MIDEGQDMNTAMFDIFLRQKCAKVSGQSSVLLEKWIIFFYVFWEKGKTSSWLIYIQLKFCL